MAVHQIAWTLDIMYSMAHGAWKTTWTKNLKVNMPAGEMSFLKILRKDRISKKKNGFPILSCLPQMADNKLRRQLATVKLKAVSFLKSMARNRLLPETFSTTLSNLNGEICVLNKILGFF